MTVLGGLCRAHIVPISQGNEDGLSPLSHLMIAARKRCYTFRQDALSMNDRKARPGRSRCEPHINQAILDEIRVGVRTIGVFSVSQVPPHKGFAARRFRRTKGPPCRLPEPVFPPHGAHCIIVAGVARPIARPLHVHGGNGCCRTSRLKNPQP